MDGEQISADQIAEVAKWPTRTEQLSLLLGQILSVGSRLNGQLIAVGGALASQIAEKAKGGEEEAAAEAAALRTLPRKRRSLRMRLRKRRQRTRLRHRPHGRCSATGGSTAEGTPAT